MSMDIFKDDVLAGKSILVTGGGSGLGLEISKSLAARGAQVHICGRRANVLEVAVAEIGHGAKAHVCDIRDADAIDAMVEAIWADGPLTGLVNNAAANFIAPTKDLSPRGFRAVTSTVMDGSFFVTLAVGKRWIAEGRKGSVVSNLVTWVWSGSAFVVPSAMAKTALHSMTMSLAVEWGKYGIRLNATAPGPFPTESAWEKLNPIPDAQSSATGCDTVPPARPSRSMAPTGSPTAATSSSTWPGATSSGPRRASASARSTRATRRSARPEAQRRGSAAARGAAAGPGRRQAKKGPHTRAEEEETEPVSAAHCRTGIPQKYGLSPESVC